MNISSSLITIIELAEAIKLAPVIKEFKLRISQKLELFLLVNMKNWFMKYWKYFLLNLITVLN